MGAAATWLTLAPRVRHAAEVAAARHDAELARAREQEAALRAEVQADLASALASVDELRVALEDARTRHRELVDQQRDARVERERAQAGHTEVLKTLTPVAEQLRSMRKRVDDLEQQRSRQHGELAEQLRSTQRTVAESKRAADTLASALSNNAVRGVWGETQLRTLVESAGLMQRVDFHLQRSIEADTGARRPDMVINLPGGKQMAVDAKAPYSAFIEASREDLDEERRQRLRVDHARKVRSHVDALASKSYWTGLAASPEFTVAFIPNDQLLTVALEADPSLMEYAFGRGVVLATPTNLWAILKTVAFTWRQDVLTEDAKELFDLGRELYRRIITMADHAEKLRRSLESTIKSYNSFAGSLETRVLVTARKLDRMDESAVIPAPAPIDLAPKALTSGDFEAIADIDDRPELDFDDALFTDPGSEPGGRTASA
ncbi:DNA recombination protein RmuC [Nocardioides panacisoli]|uniref:DNA recombination protein RmuC n=1 Tax=Nocardioides panacisoli TaxID=627624 RepID=A0ABP7IQP7_9ACTN